MQTLRRTASALGELESIKDVERLRQLDDGMLVAH